MSDFYQLDPVVASIKHKSAIDVDNRVIYIYEAIDNDECLKIGYYLDRFVRLDELLGEKKDIKICINSPGGSIYSSMLVIGRIEHMQEKLGYQIVAQAEGIVASAALDIYLVCNKRLAWNTSTFLYHSGSSIASGTIGNVANEAKEAVRLWNLGCDLARKHTMVTDEWLERVYETNMDYFMDAQMAKTLGFVDEII